MSNQPNQPETVDPYRTGPNCELALAS